MFTLANFKKLSTFIFLVGLTAALAAEYTYSDKYLFSFYVPARYKKQQVASDFGPFFVFSHPDAKLFIHFWARSKPRGADLDFLRTAYEEDFMQPFVSRVTQKASVAKVEKKHTQLVTYEVEILERDYQAELFLTRKSGRFYAIGFYFPKGEKRAVTSDIDLMIYSLIYGR